MALDLRTKRVSPKYLPNKWLHFEKMLLVLLSKFKMHTKSECSDGVSWYLKLLFSQIHVDNTQTTFERPHDKTNK